MNFQRIHVLLVAISILAPWKGIWANETPTEETADGPTPYPSKDAEWPGKGPVRVFGWMVDNRAEFWKQREKAQGTVVFAGDSLLGGWKGLAEAFPKLKVANRAIGGEVSRGLLYRFQEDVLDLHPRAIVICTGTNDLSTHADPAVVEHNLKLMIAQARAQDPALPVVLCLVPPRDVADAPIKPGALADLNARIAKVGADQKNLVVVDLYTPLATSEGKPKEELFGKDRIHPAPPAYKIWAELLQPALAGLGIK